TPASATTRSHPATSATLVSNMRGANEVPGPGDPDAKARAVIRLGGTEVCFDLEWSNGVPLTAAHIHVGQAGVAGGVAVTLFSAPDGLPATLSSVSGCIEDVDPALVQAIIDHPRNYYVNIHNAEFPGGAARGQLHHGKIPMPHA